MFLKPLFFKVRLAGDALFDFSHGDVKRTLRDNMKCDIEEKMKELGNMFDPLIIQLLRGMLKKKIDDRLNILQALDQVKKAMDALKVDLPKSEADKKAPGRGTRKMSTLVTLLPKLKAMDDEAEVEKKTRKILKKFSSPSYALMKGPGGVRNMRVLKTAPISSHQMPFMTSMEPSLSAEPMRTPKKDQ